MSANLNRYKRLANHPELEAQLVAAFHAGATITHLCAEFGLSHPVVSAALKRNGVDTQANRYKERDRPSLADSEEFQEAANNNQPSVTTLARQFGVSRQTIYNALAVLKERVAAS